MFERRHWIPPGGLIFAQASHGLSWALLLWIAIFGSITGLSIAAVAWIHLVVLGWFTVAALSVLLHVIPATTDQSWRFEKGTRTALGFFAIGIALFVLALLSEVRYAGVTAAIVYVALLVYLGAAFVTLAQARHAEQTERAIARAFAITLLLLGIVASLGLLLALNISGRVAASWIVRLPAAHASLGFYGWLSLLVYGVSARTLRPMSGAPLPRLTHIVNGTATLLGAVTLSVGLAAGSIAAAWAGGVLIAVGAVVYCAAVATTLLRATTPHRPPQAFIGASILWLLISLVIAAEVLAGRASPLVFGFLTLIGWIGQMVNAHVFHLGVRLIATIYRGEDDETRPQELLDLRLEWVSFGFCQAAVACVATGLGLALPNLVIVGAAAGTIGWVAMFADLGVARTRALHFGQAPR